jgi:ribosomal protein S18 acetylase RimI-like enzyme
LRRRVLEEGGFFVTDADELVTRPEQLASLFGAWMDAPNSTVLVGRIKGSVVGYLTIVGGQLRRTQHAGQLEILLDVEARGAGIGRHMMDAAVEWAIANSAIDKLVLIVFADNEPAVRLYRGVGFREEGRRMRQYRELDGRYRDDVLMSLWVGADQGS